MAVSAEMAYLACNRQATAQYERTGCTACSPEQLFDGMLLLTPLLGGSSLAHQHASPPTSAAPSESGSLSESTTTRATGMIKQGGLLGVAEWSAPRDTALTPSLPHSTSVCRLR